MPVKLLWSAKDWAPAVAELPVHGPLPCRTVLVPRERIAHGLRRELILSGRHEVLAGTRFLFTPAAALEVLRAAQIEAEPGEDELRATRLLALFHSNLQLRHFSLDLLRSKPGWDQSFAHTISDLESGGFRPEDFDASNTPTQLRDVVVIWRALDESAGHSWTAQRIFSEAAKVLDRSPERWPFDGSVLAIAGTDLTPAEAAFIRAIPQATVGLLISRPTRKRYLERMEQLLGAEAGAALGSAEAPRCDASERDLLASYFFEQPSLLADPKRPRSRGPDGTVSLEEHAGVEAELEATANWVTYQVKQGIPLEELAVLVPSTDPLAALVADRLQRLPFAPRDASSRGDPIWHEGSFPVHVAGGLPISSSAAGARALAVVRALRQYLAAEAMIDVLPVLRLKDHPGDHLSRGIAADLIWSLGIVGGNPAHPEGGLEWSQRARERETELEQQLERTRIADDRDDEADSARALRDLERRLGDLRGIRPALDALVELARSALHTGSLASLWPNLRSFAGEWLLQPGEGPRIEDALEEQLGKIGADRTCGSLEGDEALRVIEQTILSTRVPVGRFGDPAVYIGSIQEAVGLMFTSVRVIGLAEGHFPSVSSEDAVIPDMLRERFGRAGEKTKLLPTASDRALQDLHALDAIVRNTKGQIVLSAPRLDVERSQREPSSVILEAAAALARPNSATGEQNSVIPDRNALTRDAFVPARLAASRFRREFPVGEASWHEGVASGVLGIPQGWRGIQSLDLERIEELSGDAAGVMDGLLGAEVLDLVVPGLLPERPISPSAVEALLNCPHAFLLRRLLGFDEPAVAPTRREIGQPTYGQLFHAAAAEFYGQYGKPFCERDGRLPDWMVVADQIADRAFARLLNEYPLVGEAVRKQQLDRLRRDMRDLLEYDWETKKRFVAAERTFGQPTPVAFRVGEEVLYLRGRIDRIDVEGDVSLIRDLKTGRAYPRLRKEEATPKRDVQIAMYGLLVARNLADELNIPKTIAAAYAYFGPRGHGQERPFRDDFHTQLEPAALNWLEIAGRLLRERLFPRTPNQDDCGYCCFRPVCGEGVYERTSRLLASKGGVLRDFAALKGLEAAEQED